MTEINLVFKVICVAEFFLYKALGKSFTTSLHHNFVSCPQNLGGKLKVLISSNSGRILNLIWIKVSVKHLNVIIMCSFSLVWKKYIHRWALQICSLSSELFKYYFIFFLVSELSYNDSQVNDDGSFIILINQTSQSFPLALSQLGGGGD